MGMLGALAGAGRGFQGFAVTMKEKQNLDWQERQNQLKYERDMNLQRLRESSATERTSMGLEARAAEGALDRESRMSIAEMNVEAQKEGREDTQAHALEVLKEQDRLATSRMGATAAKDLETYKAKLTAQKEMEDEATREQLAAITNSEYFKNLPPDHQELVQLSINAGGTFTMKDLMKVPKQLEAPTSGHLTQAREILQEDEVYQNAGTSGKLIMVAMEATKFANPGTEVGGNVVIREDQLVQTVKDFREGKMTGYDLMSLEPESLKMLMDAVSQFDTKEETRPVRTPEFGQGQAYMKEQTEGMFAGPRAAYQRAKEGMASRRAGEVPITNPRR